MVHNKKAHPAHYRTTHRSPQQLHLKHQSSAGESLLRYFDQGEYWCRPSSSSSSLSSSSRFLWRDYCTGLVLIYYYYTMKPFQRFRSKSHVDHNHHAEHLSSSVVSSSRRNKKQQAYLAEQQQQQQGGSSHATTSNSSKNRENGLAQSTTSSQRRSRSVERRGDRSRSRSRKPSKWEKRQGDNTGDPSPPPTSSWFDRFGGGSAVSGGSSGKRRSKSLEQRGAMSTSSNTSNRNRSRSRPRRRSKSRERSSSSRIIRPRSQSRERRSTSKGNKRHQSSTDTMIQRAPHHHSNTTHTSSTMMPVPTDRKSAKQKTPSPPNLTSNAPLVGYHHIPAQLPLAAPPTSVPVGTSSSAFQRWPRLPNFRKNKNKGLEIDQEKRERLLRMILGNTGSMFEDRSTLNAPRGEHMRTSTTDYHPGGMAAGAARGGGLYQHYGTRGDEEQKPPKSFAEHLVDAALFCEAMTAWPYIFIQTICCVQDDYLEPERAKLDHHQPTPGITTTTTTTNRKNDKKFTAKSSANDGPPVVIKVAPKRPPTPESISIRKQHDAQSVSIFTLGSDAGIFGGLCRCGDSVTDEREEHIADEERDNCSTPDHSLGKDSPINRSSKPSTPVVMGEIVETGLFDSLLAEEAPSQSFGTKTGPSVRATKMSAWHSSKPNSKSKQDNLESRASPEIHTNDAEHESRVDDVVKQSNSNQSMDESEDAMDGKDDASSDVGAAVKSSKKLEEWEAMEAKLKAFLDRAAGGSADENSFSSD